MILRQACDTFVEVRHGCLSERSEALRPDVPPASGFTMVIISALTLGIATNIAMFSVVDTVQLNPFAYEAAPEKQDERNGSNGGRLGVE
jgi:hypothetical protein